ncbi:hypothetical protein Tco_0405821 [Tanacetum coccineum]
MPILYSFEENKLEYEDEDEVEIKMMGTGMDKESLEHNLKRITDHIILSIIFLVNSHPPMQTKGYRVIFDERSLKFLGSFIGMILGG